MKNFFTLIVALICGVFASQFPEYAQQYRQRLAGAVGELERVVAQFDADANEGGLSRNDALARYQKSGDDFLEDRGDSMGQTISRYIRLNAHLTAMNKANPAERLWVFATQRDMQLAEETLEIYEPAVPVTTVGAAHAAGGFALGWLLLSLLMAPFKKRRAAHRA
ncbi:DUF2937 family protein [Robiginitomaculum antarcticum]|uniref:DUF2937 family protein n=1 Tax=Robiginitomaculum antarcticum TaxID=437507 RepID=UPI0003670EA5|nr:DUF2937 family protein [Robiginitomaculum antarcticum]